MFQILHIVIANGVKQSQEIATLACFNATSACRHVATLLACLPQAGNDNLVESNFEFVSSFDIRISDFQNRRFW